MSEEVKEKAQVNKAKKEKKPRVKKLPKMEVYHKIRDIINAGFNGNKFYVESPEPGVKRILKRVSSIDEDLVTYVPQEAVYSELVHFLQTDSLYSEVPDLKLTPNGYKEAVELWATGSFKVPTPKMYAWPGERGLTFVRLPWEQENKDCPAWESLVDRMSNQQGFMDWIGSLFVEDSSLQDYCYIYGQGGDGKGCINRFLSRVFGKGGYRSVEPPKINGNNGYWAYGLLGARLVAFADCSHAGFVSSGYFKALTGGDPVNVECKYQMPYTAVLNAKYIFFSNEQPKISSEIADIRRIVYCEFEKQGEYDHAFEDKLWAEGGGFLYHCIAGYKKRYPHRGAIKTGDNEKLELVVESNEEHFQKFFDENFQKTIPEYQNFEKYGRLIKKEACFYSVNSRIILEKINENNGNFECSKINQAKFLVWLRTKHKIIRRRGYEGNVRFSYYFGIVKNSLYNRSVNSLLRIEREE